MDVIKKFWKGKDRAQQDPVTAGPSDHASDPAQIPTEFRYGLGDPVFEDSDPTVDIIAIHGLNGDRITTWTDPQSEVFWLRDLLPTTLKAEDIRARIFSYGYNADTNSARAVSVQDLWSHGQSFLAEVIGARRKVEDRPLIFVVHSLGGLILKSALIQSNSCNPSHFPRGKALVLSTHGILFCGVPHQGGSGTSEGKILLNAGSVITHTTTKIVQILEPGSEVLTTQRNQYVAIANNFHTVALYETEATPFKVKSILVVPYDSAVVPGQSGARYALPIAMAGKNHITMVKFSSKDDSAYRILSTQLINILEESYEGVNQVSDQIPGEQNYGGTLLRPRLPHAPSPRFCGRSDELGKIKSFLGPEWDECQTVVAVYGVGGMGKTELALQYTYHNQQNYSSVIWVNGKDRKNAEKAYIDALQDIIDAEVKKAPNFKPDFRKIATDFNIVGLLDANGRLEFAEDDDDAVWRIISSLKRWFERDLHGSWLLIFDNHDDLSFKLRDFFPNCSRGSIIITSRRPDIKSYATHYHEVGGLDEESAIKLLLIVSERDETIPEVRSEARKIVKKLQYLPLAIDQAAAFLSKRQHLPLESYIPRYERKWKELFEKNEHPWPDYEQTCATTWEISRQAVREQSRLASTLLQVCSFFNNDDIWGELLRRSLYFEGSKVPDEEVDEIISLLFSYSLIKPKTGGDTFSIHAVVHTWARERLDPDDKLFTCVAAVRMMKDAVLFVKDSGEERSPAEYVFEKRILQHLEAFLDTSESVLGLITIRKISRDQPSLENSFRARVLCITDDTVKNAQLVRSDSDAEEVGPSLFVSRRYIKSTNAIDPEFAKKIIEPYNLTSDSLTIIAKALDRQGRHKASAKVQATLVFFIVGLTDKIEIPVVLTPVVNLAYQMQHLERYREAERLFRFFLQEWPTSHSKTLTYVPVAKNGLAVTLNKLGRYSEANALYEELRPLRTDGQGYWTSEELQSMTDSQIYQLHNEGVRLNDQGQHAAAERLFRAILPVRLSRLTLEHPEACRTLHNLAIALEKQGKLEEAEPLHRQVLEIRQNLFAEGHGDIIRSMNNLAVVLKKTNRLDEASDMYAKALLLSIQYNGRAHTGTITIRKNLALVLAQQKDFKAAAPELGSCAKALVSMLGVEHPLALRAICDWAFCLVDLKRLRGASNLFWYVLQVRRPQVGVQDKAMNEAFSGLQLVADRYAESGQAERAQGIDAKIKEYHAFVRSRDAR